MTKGAWQCRPFVECQRDLERVRDGWLLDDPILDPSRGDQRLAAEVALCVLTARDVPSFAHERAMHTLTILANQ